MNEPRIIVRVDGGPEIGMGHVVRSIRLSRAINEKIQSNFVFVTSTPEELRHHIDSNAWNPSIHTVRNISESIEFYEGFDPHVVITDVPVLDDINAYIRAVEKFPLHISLGERYFNYFSFGMVVFPSVLPVKPKCACESKADYFIGPKYLLIDPHLKDLPQTCFDSGKPLRILVAMGGADPRGWTQQIISESKKSNLDKKNAVLNIVIGSANPHRDIILKESNKVSFVNIIEPQPDLFEIIRECDIAITSGGTTAYETIAGGRPTWVIPEIEFEEQVAETLKSKGAIIDSGLDSLNEQLFNRIESYRQDYSSLVKIIKTGRKYIDGKGLNRIVDKIVSNLDIFTDK